MLNYFRKRRHAVSENVVMLNLFQHLHSESWIYSPHYGHIAIIILIGVIPLRPPREPESGVLLC